jgi:glycosyltransferase involved in cell wall biosynthesis
VQQSTCIRLKNKVTETLTSKVDTKIIKKSLSDCHPVRIRWVTWWPVEYWTERFNHLADYVEVEVVFLSRKSLLLPQNIDHSKWRFKYRTLSNKQDSTGYQQASHAFMRLPRPWTLLEGDFDALVMTYSDPTCILAAIIGGQLRKKIFLFAPNTKEDSRKESWLRELLKRYLLNSSDGVLVTGPLQREYAKCYVTKDSLINSIGNPAPLLPNPDESRDSTRKEIQSIAANEDSEILLFVGRLSSEKGLHTLLESLSIYKMKQNLCPTLVIIGDGPEENNLKNIAESKNLPVVFAGFKQGSSLSNYYSAADIFVLPSKSEPWGLVVNEAMQFGLPLILSNKVGSAPVLLGESGSESGVSFPSGDSLKLYECIQTILTNKDLRESMGRNSSNIIKDHSIDAWCQAVLQSLQVSSLSNA